MKKKGYDFSGWATKNDLLCADGRIIRKDAFKENDGQVVPLVWNHQHDDPLNVLGHALLENREDGVYAYCLLNDTLQGKNTKALVEHGDITSMSIWANHLQHNGNGVVHGLIREVSLVLAGANPGACIESVISHSEDGGYVDDEEGVIYSGEELSIKHSDEEDAKVDETEESKKPEEDPKEDPKEPEPTPEPEPVDEVKHSDDTSEETVGDVIKTLNEKQMAVVEALVSMALKEKPNANGEVTHADIAASAKTSTNSDGETIADVLATLSEKQLNAVYFLVGQALDEDPAEEDNKGEDTMKHNVFDTDQTNENENVLSHDDMTAIIKEAQRTGSLRESVLAHGITDVEYLFPDAKTLDTPPYFIQRDMGWVAGVMNGAHHSPISRIKSMFANITEDEARAKGYIKGKLKKEEVFSLLKRSTDPQTVYKKQRMDRDDVIDITDFDVIGWLKSEMRMMLDEEIARAILVGDGRLASDDDKISEDHIRPIFNDADLYTIKVKVGVAKGATDAAKAKEFIKSTILARKNYKGSGNPVLYCTEDALANMLLLEDGIGHFMYPNQSVLATTLRVSSIITVPVMDGVKNAAGLPLWGIVVNLSDYNIGADKGGAVNMFEDFDIDYNQQKYLIETRCSGALIRPYSAMAIFIEEAIA